MSQHLFVSYASNDQPVAMEVCALLEARGVSCWIAPRDVAAGKVWDEAILDAIEGASAFLLLLSAHANASAFVKNEVNRAFSLNKPIVTFRIEEVMPGRSLELYLARHHWTDGFGGSLDAHIDQLASSVTALVGAAPVSAVVSHAPSTSAPKPKSAARLTRRERLAWSVTAAALIGVAVLALPAIRSIRAAPGPSPEMRLDLVIPQERSFGFALSPDGSTLAFENEKKLWVRAIDEDAAHPIAGTDALNGGTFFPFWSPDSTSIGFFADNKLRRVDLATSSVRTIADLPGWTGNGATWNRDNVIVFGTSSDGTPLYRVSADGGTPVAVTKLAADERTQRFPQFLPDGRRFIFFARTTTSHGLRLGSLDSMETKRLLDADGKAVIVPPDTVLFARNGALLAQHFNVADMSPRGTPVPVAGAVAADLTTRNTSLSADVAVTASDAGTVIYQASTPTYQAVLFDRSGAEIGRFAEDIKSQVSVRPTSFSPDGRVLAMGRSSAGNIDLWLFDVDRKLPPRRVTSNPAFDGIGVWSPDGKQIVYASNRKGVFDLYVKTVDADDERPLLESIEGKAPDDWSSDGRYILFQDANPSTSDDIWALPLFGDRKPIPIARTPALECCGRFSPDGRWVSYNSWETGRSETYVQPFPGTTGRIRLSANGGGMSSWSADGREFYYGTNAETMALSVTYAAHH